MTVFSKSDKSAVFGFSESQAKLKLVEVGGEVDHKTAFGRIAISCPKEQVGLTTSVM